MNNINNFTPFSVIITQELDTLILNALLALIENEKNAQSIVNAAAVIAYFNQARLSQKEKERELKEERPVKEKIKKS